MKRILLVISLFSLASQAPMHGFRFQDRREPKGLALIQVTITPETLQVMKENFNAYAYDAKQLVSKAPQLAEKVLQGTETVLTMPFVLAGKGLEGLAKGLEYGAKAIEPQVKAGVEAIEPTVTPIVQTIGNGLVSAGNGLVYVGTHFPVTSMVALSALSIASWAKAIKCDQSYSKKNQAPFYMSVGAVSGFASMAVLANVLVENGIQF